MLMEIIVALLERVPKIAEVSQFPCCWPLESPDPGIQHFRLIHEQRPVGPERRINADRRLMAAIASMIGEVIGRVIGGAQVPGP